MALAHRTRPMAPARNH